MKTNFTAKLFGLTLVTALTLTTLTACGNGGAAASSGTASGSALQSGDGGSVGTVLLSVNPEIEMDYDEVGNVVALTGLNEDGKAVLASYTGYEGKPCATVVGELVDEINAGGYFDATIDGHEKNIVLKLERGSAYPNDQFLNELAEAVRLVVEADQIGSQTVALDTTIPTGTRATSTPPPPRISCPPSWAGMTSSLWRRSTTWTTGSMRWSLSWTAWSTSTR